MTTIWSSVAAQLPPCINHHNMNWINKRCSEPPPGRYKKSLRSSSAKGSFGFLGLWLAGPGESWENWKHRTSCVDYIHTAHRTTSIPYWWDRSLRALTVCGSFTGAPGAAAPGAAPANPVKGGLIMGCPIIGCPIMGCIMGAPGPPAGDWLYRDNGADWDFESAD